MDFEVYVEKIQVITCSQTPEEAFYLLDQAFKGSVPIKEYNEPVINVIIALMAGIAPQDPVEAMLAVQMVAVHNHCMELLADAVNKTTFFDTRKQYIDIAANAPMGNKNALKHGFYSAESIARRRDARRLVKESWELMSYIFKEPESSQTL